MSPRPKRSPDADIIAAAAQVVAERGAGQTRLADVAVASGFAAATLVQRFGSREGLLQAVGDTQRLRISQTFQSGSGPFLERIAAALLQLYSEGHIAFHLASPENAPAYSLELRKALGRALAQAVDSGELPHCDIAAQARRIQLGFYALATAAILEGEELRLESVQDMEAELLADFM